MHRMVSSSSSSKSSSSSSSPSPFASASGAGRPRPHTPRRTMEEVWKDIALGAAATPALDAYARHRHPADATRRSSPAAATLSCFRGNVLQDFLARPFGGPTSQPAAALAAAAAEEGTQLPHYVHGAGILLASPPGLPPQPSAPATFLCLDSRLGLQYVDAAVAPSRRRSFGNIHDRSRSIPSCPRRPSSSPSVAGAPPANISDDSLGCQGFFPLFSGRKRDPGEQQLGGSDGSGSDRRHKRMIKNRESAARSRARKQAYTNELEQEVKHLTEENQKLKRQHEELRARIAAQLPPTREPLQRSSTAPF